MLDEAQLKALLAEASGGPLAPMFPTFNPTTGKLTYPGRGKKAVRPRGYQGKKKAARKRTRQSRKRNRRR